MSTTPDVSLPSRERGLKPVISDVRSKCLLVAPLAGAWIETNVSFIVSMPVLVAPLAGAWIETQTETQGTQIVLSSLPSRERGLKQMVRQAMADAASGRSPRGSVD